MPVAHDENSPRDGKSPAADGLADQSAVPTDVPGGESAVEDLFGERDEGAGQDAADVHDLAPEPDTGPPPQVDCSHLPQGPFFLEKVPEAIASEDLAFDGKGHLVGSNNKAIFKTTADGQVSLFTPNMQFRAGLAYLPNGWLVVCDNELNRLVKIDPDGVKHVLLEGLAYPNGIAIDLKGYVYVTEENAGRVLRVHSYTGEYTVLTEEVSHPNGIAFNKSYDTLYIGSFGAGWIYTLSISEGGVPGRLEEWGDMTHTSGLLDGIGVDICGNVYVCDYGATDIWRFPPSGKFPVKILDADTDDTYLPNMRWGRGPGWDPYSFYLPDGWKHGVWRVKIGVPSVPLPFP